ncbi:hybrid sensor histidine kinase/response regulator transcription factor [Larkinella sp. GY13]|uniref:hybrid sensor histidine kinase/response regulator transcription factor n=1 Tax=Larkinella sp. GY13 TaxID=3453720 RepID=UPI003EEADE18
MPQKFHPSFWLVTCTLLSLDGQSQSKFNHLTTRNGLSHNTVMDLIQDDQGFLWVGTADGLNRYDGEQFRTYRRSARDTSSLSHNYINCLFKDRQHRLWVGTHSGGINRLDASGVRFIHYNQTTGGQDISGAIVTDIVQDWAGFIWASTSGHGLLRIEPELERVTQFTVANSGLPFNLIHQLCVDGSGYLWLGNQEGRLARMRLSDHRLTTLTLPAPNRGAPAGIMTIQCDNRGAVWVGTKGSGLYRSHAGKTGFQLVFYKTGVIEGLNNARSLYVGPDGRYWLGTDDGLVVADDSSFRYIRHLRHNPSQPNTLSTHAIVCVQGDRQGNIWVGTWEGGLNVAFNKPAPFNLYTYQPGLPGLLTQTVAAVAVDSVGNAWVGSTQGLTYIDRKNETYRHFRHQPGNPHSLPSNDVTHLFRLSETAMLVTVWNQGTVLFNPITGRVQKRLTVLGTNPICPVLPMRGGKVRLINRQGRSWWIDRQTGKIGPAPDLIGLPPSIRALITTTDGSLLGATYGSGLLVWPRQDRLPRIHAGERRPGRLYDNILTCLLEDRRGQYWVGTRNGLHRYDRRSRRFSLLTTENGLPNDAIMSLSQDRDGYLWVATNDGLCQLTEAGRILRTYRREDGLAGNDFSEGAVAQHADGTLFWAGKHGLTVLRPHRLDAQLLPVPVYLSHLKLFNRPVVPGAPGSPLTRSLADTQTLTLRFDQSVITFDFAAVLFRAHRNVRYAYRLDGFEDIWNYVGAQHSATYTNQSPGTYRFRVKASLTDDFTGAPETSFELIILPPWYRTIWAYAAYVLLILALLIGMRRLIQIRESYKTELRAEHLEAEKARELDRIRSGFFTNISHEFRTPLTLILTPLEHFLTDRNPDSRRPQFQTMHQNANRLLRLINQLLDLSKLESDSLRPDISRQDIVDFVRRVAGSFSAQASKQGITLRVDTEPDKGMAWFDPDILEKVLYNLLANALKFTRAEGLIVVRCRLMDADASAGLLLEVEDTGLGISAEHTAHIFERFYQVNGHHHTKKAGTGIGLALTRELVELHGGQISVESQPGAGTVFVVRLPVHASAFPVSWLSIVIPSTDLADSIAWPEKDPFQLSSSGPGPVASDRPLVLIVEDHDDLRNYLTSSLGQYYRVMAANNGREALQQAQNEIPDLVLSDWLMPDMDGVQLCVALKTDERTSHVPVLLLTSRSSTESKVEGLGAGADDYVTKPFNLEVLLSRISNLIQNRRLLRSRYRRMLTIEPVNYQIESAEEVFLQKVMTLINAHVADPDLAVLRLERELGMSNTQLYRKLKALTGKGGNDLIRSVRLQRAAQLLQSGGHQVAEVAYAVGFSDPNYFTRAFKKEFGQSPGEWINAKQQQMTRQPPGGPANR